MVLVLFAFSWINLVVQAPVHASMKQDMTLSQEVMDCYWTQALCSAVLSLEDQANDIVHLALPVLNDTHIAFVIYIQDEAKQVASDIQFAFVDLNFRESQPPPLSLTTILQI